MKLKPYDEILKMGKEAVDAMMLPIRTRQMRKAGELEMAKLEEKTAVAAERDNHALR